MSRLTLIILSRQRRCRRKTLPLSKNIQIPLRRSLPIRQWPHRHSRIRRRKNKHLPLMSRFKLQLSRRKRIQRLKTLPRFFPSWLFLPESTLGRRCRFLLWSICTRSNRWWRRGNNSTPTRRRRMRRRRKSRFKLLCPRFKHKLLRTGVQILSWRCWRSSSSSSCNHRSNRNLFHNPRLQGRRTRYRRRHTPGRPRLIRT